MVPLPTVVLMLKAPVAGEVKTRLGRQIGMDLAAAIYRRLVEHQLAQIPQGWPSQICFAPAVAADSMREWLGTEREYSAQVEGDLGARLTAAAARHFASSASSLLVIGGDCPALTAPRFVEVAGILRQHEVVLVPATDGGYCLIAMRRFLPDIFSDIPWSTASVLVATRTRLAAQGVAWQETAPLEDVDDHASWQRAVAADPRLALPELSP